VDRNDPVDDLPGTRCRLQRTDDEGDRLLCGVCRAISDGRADGGNADLRFRIYRNVVLLSLDAWRTAAAIRSGVTPDVADDLLVKQFSGNPKLWGGVMLVLGMAFLVQRLFNVGPVMRGLLPIMLLGLGVYLVKGQFFKPKAVENDIQWSSRQPSASFALTQTHSYEVDHDPNQYADRARTGSWRDVN